MNRLLHLLAEDDPRGDPRLLAAVRELGLDHPLDSDAWTRRLSPPPDAGTNRIQSGQSS